MNYYYEMEKERIERRIEDLEEKNRELELYIKERKNKKANPLSLDEQRRDALDIANDEINVYRNQYSISYLKAQKLVTSLEVDYKNGKISDKEYKRLKKIYDKEIARSKELSKLFNEITNNPMVSSPDALLVIANSSKSVREMGLFIYTLSRLKETNNIEDIQLNQIVNYGYDCLREYHNTIDRYYLSQGDKLFKSFGSLEKKSKRYKRYSKDRFDSINQTLSTFAVLSDIHNLNRDDRIIISKEGEQYTTSKSLPRKLNTFPSEHIIDEIRMFCSPEEYGSIIGLKNSVRNLDIIDSLEKMIPNIQNSLKSEYIIGGQKIDFNNFLSSLNEYKKFIKKEKNSLQSKLKDYLILKEKVEKQQRIIFVTRTLSYLYKEQESLNGNERAKKEMQIQKFLLELKEEGFSDTEVFLIGQEAREVLKRDQEEKENKELESLKRKKESEDRSTYIRKGLDPQTYERIKAEAIIAAKGRGIQELVFENGDYGIENPEFIKFVEDYIEAESERILGHEFDDMKRQEKSDESLMHEIERDIIDNELNGDMIEFAVMQLFRKGSISDSNYDRLSLVEQRDAVKLAAKLKLLSHLSDEEITIELAKETYKDELVNGMPTDRQILAQKNLNEFTGILNGIRYTFNNKSL